MSSSGITATDFYRNGIIYVRTLPNREGEPIYKIGSTDCRLVSRYDNANATEIYKFKKYDRVYIIHYSSKLTCKQIDNKLKQDIDRGFMRTAEHITNSGGNEIYCYSGKHRSDIFNELEKWFKQNKYSFIIAPSNIEKYDDLGHLKLPSNMTFEKYVIWLESRKNKQSSDLPKYLSELYHQNETASHEGKLLEAQELKLQMDEIETLCIQNPDFETNRHEKQKGVTTDNDGEMFDVSKPTTSKSVSFILITKGNSWTNYDDQLITDNGTSLIWYGQKKRTTHDNNVVIGTHVFYRNAPSKPYTYKGTVSKRTLLKERTKTSPIKVKLELNTNAKYFGRVCDDIDDGHNWRYQDACWRTIQLPKFNACGQGFYRVALNETGKRKKKSKNEKKSSKKKRKREVDEDSNEEEIDAKKRRKETNHYGNQTKMGMEIINLVSDDDDTTDCSTKCESNGHSDELNAKKLHIKEGDNVELQSDMQHAYYSVLIEGKLTVNDWNPNKQMGGKLIIKSLGDFVIGKRGHIDLNFKGYRGGSGKNGKGMCGESFNRPSVEQTGSNLRGGGGSKNGRGGNAGYAEKGKELDADNDDSMCNGEAGMKYGDALLTVLHLGSGGGSGGGDDGGAGGGAIKISCSIFRNEGQITANGNAYPNKKGGSGSGGSIFITAKHFENTGFIEALSGEGKCRNEADSGMIRIDVSNNDKMEQKIWKCIEEELISPTPYFF